MLFHKSGPQKGQPRGYAFVTYKTVGYITTTFTFNVSYLTEFQVRDAHIALDKMHGQLIEKRPLVVRLAKNINYVCMIVYLDTAFHNLKYSFQDLLEKPKPKIEIPALAAGSSTTEKITVSKGITVEAIEAKLRVLEQRRNDLEINKNQSNEPPLIQKYQYNKTNDNNSKYSSTKLVTQSRYQRNQRHKNSGPYNRRGRR